MEAGMVGKRRGDKRSSGSISSSNVSTKFSFTASTNTPSLTAPDEGVDRWTDG